ncbi:NUDIX hydrolase [Streptococcus ictaluri]|uniref:Hydrolase, NUDIX family n=1 Tax=Streptococcus ictaluri 707-05 TaxID=764299 RepID=G5K4I6_9STRE|nr:NUDIX domain-containing protein [Streptococcus ictaluri]EHI69253.1 hydrolase, NUDIX family [Streptococcus ictaluri 707-05]
MVELWDVYARNHELTGQTMERGSSFENDCYHLVVHLCLFNRQGEMLIQQRQDDKAGWPSYWDLTVGGSALTGETSQVAAERELFEELGLKINLNELRPQFTINFDHGFDDIFLLEKEVDINSLVFQAEEVQAAKWASKAEINRMITEGTFIPYYPSLIDLCFDLVGKYGAHQL